MLSDGGGTSVQAAAQPFLTSSPRRAADSSALGRPRGRRRQARGSHRPATHTTSASQRCRPAGGLRAGAGSPACSRGREAEHHHREDVPTTGSPARRRRGMGLGRPDSGGPSPDTRMPSARVGADGGGVGIGSDRGLAGPSTSSIRPYSFAPSAERILSRSMSLRTRLDVAAGCWAMVSSSQPRMRMISLAWISRSEAMPPVPSMAGWWMSTRAVREGEALALGAGAEEHGGRRGRLPDDEGLHVGADVLHRVVDRRHRRERATGAVDVHEDVAVGVLRLEHDELRDDVVGGGVVDLHTEEDDAVLEEAWCRGRDASCRTRCAPRTAAGCSGWRGRARGGGRSGLRSCLSLASSRPGQSEVTGLSALRPAMSAWVMTLSTKPYSLASWR